ncbi:MAG: integration host factor subunit beta, partial [Verrucomicrobiaceae bacterium]
MTKSELIQKLSSSHPDLRADDLEKLVNTIFE